MFIEGCKQIILIKFITGYTCHGLNKIFVPFVSSNSMHVLGFICRSQIFAYDDACISFFFFFFLYMKNLREKIPTFLPTKADGR